MEDKKEETMDEKVARVEAAVTKMETERRRLEELRADKLIAGQAEAGLEPKKTVETPEQYKNRIMRGEL